MGNANTATNANTNATSPSSSETEYSAIMNILFTGYKVWVFCEVYLLFPILIVGIFGHIWTWTVYGRRWKNWKSTSKIYLFIMTICDVVALLTYSLPQFLYMSLEQWTNGGFQVTSLLFIPLSCQILRYLLQVSFVGANVMVICVSFETLLALSRPSADLSVVRSQIVALVTMAIICIICILLPFSYTVNLFDLSICVLNSQQPSALYITVVAVETLTLVLPPIILLVCNVLLVYYAQKLRAEASSDHQIRVVPVAATKRRARMVVESLGISIWTNIAITPLILLEIVPLMLVSNPDVLSWSLQQLYTYNTLVIWSHVALILSQIACATNWAVYSYWVKFFWRDSWSYLKCHWSIDEIGANREDDVVSRQTALSEVGRNGLSRATSGNGLHVQFDV